MNTSFNLWVNRTPRADSTHDIFIRLTQNRRHKSLKTGISIKNITDFNPKAKPGNWIRGKAANIKKLNHQLEMQIEALKSSYRELESKKELPSNARIINVYRGGEAPDFMPHLKGIIDNNYAVGKFRTAKSYNQLYGKLLKFMKGKELPFDQITPEFIRNFLASLSSLHHNTIQAHYKNFKAAYNVAIAFDKYHPARTPFIKSISITPIDTQKEKLTMDEIRRIKELELEEGSPLWHTWNCFLFAFYCGGIRSGDLITMRWSNIVDDKLMYVMAKTKGDKLIQKEVPLHKEALQILQCYHSKNNRPGDFIFQWIENKYSKYINREKKITSGYESVIYGKIEAKNTIINKNLKRIATLAEIDKPLTFHIARHSFSQYAIDQEMNPKVLQQILGHTKFETTEAYIKTLSNKTINEAINKLFNP